MTHTLPGKAGNKGGSSNLNYRKPNKTPAQERVSKRKAAYYQAMKATKAARQQ